MTQDSIDLHESEQRFERKAHGSCNNHQPKLLSRDSLKLDLQVNTVLYITTVALYCLPYSSYSLSHHTRVTTFFFNLIISFKVG